ncbi:MAG: DUF1858 domain-containing protein [Candidatus Pacearchaeota archaeon]|jgi:hybrid cluster-associated redox disulfide protein
MIKKTKAKKKNLLKNITKEMLITDIIEKYPDKSFEIAQAMGEAGLHCIGCQAAVYETLKQGMLFHGFTEKELDKLVIKLNKIIQKKAD